MLLLVFRIAEDAYAIEAARVVELVPRVVLRSLPHAPEALAGLFRYRGRMVPVLDLGILLGSGPCRSFLSTRIILVNEASPAEGTDVIGLIAQDVVDVLRIDGDRIIPPPALLGRNPYLGSIVSTDNGLIPLIAVERVFAEPLRAIVAEAAP
jgi:chemotaxis-related protein WspB